MRVNPNGKPVKDRARKVISRTCTLSGTPKGLEISQGDNVGAQEPLRSSGSAANEQFTSQHTAIGYRSRNAEFLVHNTSLGTAENRFSALYRCRATSIIDQDSTRPASDKARFWGRTCGARKYTVSKTTHRTIFLDTTSEHAGSNRVETKPSDA
eukprot:CAMPEP_0114539596 /NCGR_PEP_ID=MMETSP0114-20121206/321_1 /TAXON_ID=31324 /ORGANISM="Goniomonas sp, Strain m" /LENGTH=153 /DNA_ID=CAMNT_0001723707 /DNA_START=423 /DNA_END=884 /DNA_ORIENTATION=-